MARGVAIATGDTTELVSDSDESLSPPTVEIFRTGVQWVGATPCATYGATIERVGVLSLMFGVGAGSLFCVRERWHFF